MSRQAWAKSLKPGSFVATTFSGKRRILRVERIGATELELSSGEKSIIRCSIASLAVEPATASELDRIRAALRLEAPLSKALELATMTPARFHDWRAARRLELAEELDAKHLRIDQAERDAIEEGR